MQSLDRMKTNDIDDSDGGSGEAAVYGNTI